MKYSGPRLTLPVATIEVHQVNKLPVGYSIVGSIHTMKGRIPITINIPVDIADVRPDDRLTLYTEIATHADVSAASIQ